MRKEFLEDVRFFPAAGLLLGLGLFLVEIVSLFFWSPDVASVLVVIAWIFMTRMVNLNGIVSTVEKLFGTRKNDSYGNLRSEPIGPVGIVSLLLVVLLKFSFLGDVESVHFFPVLIIVGMNSRALILFLLRFFPAPTNPDDRVGRGNTDHRSLLLVFGICAAFSLLIAGPVVFLVFASAGVPIFLFGLYLSKKTGGLTDESRAALTEIAEILFLAMMTASQRLILFPVWRPFLSV